MTDLTLLTARLAMLLYAAALALLLLRRRARMLYSAGAVVFVLHVAAAFHFRHHWSHAEALDNVRVQTLALTGVASGAGLWLNYLFTAVWAIDVCWWWSVGDNRYHTRRQWITIAVHGFLLFMAINATIVFAGGATRIAGVVALLVLLHLALRRRNEQRSNSVRK